MYHIEPPGDTPFAFIPQHLQIIGRPELAVFPHNILYVSNSFDELNLTGEALYVPVLDSFIVEGDHRRMRYLNQYGPQDFVKIDYNAADKAWRGEKFINGTLAAISFGKSWKVFFIHLTMTGVVPEEACKYTRP